MDNKWEDVRLSPMAFVGVPLNLQKPFDIKASPNEPELDRAQMACNIASSEPDRSDLHEQPTTEKIGEELRPGAAVWQMYREEAKEHDEELVNGQTQNLDMMLLFATLFSAVLSAFLIESKKLLEQDPADASLKLLLLIAQSQQRVERGAPQLISAPIELPSFSVSHSARWINGLWFVSLGLSLSAALVAMLAKEWLAASLHLYLVLLTSIRSCIKRDSWD